MVINDNDVNDLSPYFPGVVVLHCSDDFLRFLSQVWREFETVNSASRVSNHDDGFLTVEGYLVEASLSRSDHFLNHSFHYSRICDHLQESQPRDFKHRIPRRRPNFKQFEQKPLDHNSPVYRYACTC